MKKLKDEDIRNLLITELKEQYLNEDVRIVEELAVLHGQSRVDVAVINGLLHGFEIKSESDNLLRLPTQIRDYNKVFERMTIVVQRNYLKDVKNMIPKWWGIILVVKHKDEYQLKTLRKGRKNPFLDSFSLSMLLWKDEALFLLKEKGLHRGYLSKPRNIIYQHISDSIPLMEIKRYVNYQLKNRKNWRES